MARDSNAEAPLNIVVGVAGGIAAYKTVSLVRALVLAGHDVHVVPTDAALRFVGQPTWEAISRNPVTSSVYQGVAEVRHVALGQQADLIVIAPATAHTLAKLATGLVDDLLGNTVLASRAPLVLVPAMHTEMWQHPATQANVAVLRERGAHIIGPEVGALTGSDIGPGRMSEPEQILAEALAVLGCRPLAGVLATARLPERDLEGLRVVISAGGTREMLDPVRFLGNRSSGKQGVALAEAARDRGAEVTLLAAHLEVPVPFGVRVVEVGSAGELREAALREAAEAELVIMAAAVADYRPREVAEQKLKKEHLGDTVSLELEKTPDVLAELSARRSSGQIVVGFAAETELERDVLLALGRAKRERKGCDYLVINRVGWQEGFGAEENSVVIIDRAGDIVGESSGAKAVVAQGILDAVLPG